jgi:23S rRNA A2030 N6-methylase RlmJ
MKMTEYKDITCTISDHVARFDKDGVPFLWLPESNLDDLKNIFPRLFPCPVTPND